MKDDCINRTAAIDMVKRCFQPEHRNKEVALQMCIDGLSGLPSVNPEIGHCKDCRYFEYDSVAKIDGIPLIVAHEICNKWGEGCKTSEDGFCFLFEPTAERSAEE